MSSIIDAPRGLIHKAVYWEPLIPDGYGAGGDITPGFPIEIDSRFIEVEEARERQVEDQVRVDRVVQVGGFLRRGNLFSLIPNNANEYPPASLPAPGTEHKFDDDLLAAAGPDFDLTSGAIIYETGAFGNAAISDGSDFLLTTASSVAYGAAPAIAVSLWVKLLPLDADLDLAEVEVDLGGNFSLVMRAGTENSVIFDGVTHDLSAGWADSYVNVVGIYSSGSILDVYVGGFLLDPSSGTPSFSGPLADGPHVITATVDDFTGIGLAGVDDLRVYLNTLSAREVQLLAAVHPTQYNDTDEINRYKATDNIKGTKTVHRTWLQTPQ
jgi:hypothetical protein